MCCYITLRVATSNHKESVDVFNSRTFTHSSALLYGMDRVFCHK
jgi:hypothetical protein